MENLPVAIRITVYIVAFFLGASIFSFLEVMIIRIPQKRSFVSGRSVCDSCGHELSALDMIPVFGWLLLGGRCRYCKAKFPPTSSIKEAAGGAILCLCLLRRGLTLTAFVGFAAICALNVSAFIALSQKKIHIPSAVTAGVLVAATAAVSVISSSDRGRCALFAAAVTAAALGIAGIARLISYAVKKENGGAYIFLFAMFAAFAPGIFLLK